MSAASKLLSRDSFREGVFSRDNHKCVICGQEAVDAHHIMERRLFSEDFEYGGYFLDNGASVCESHHIECEQTIISTSEVRKAAKISKVVLPSHLYEDEQYDKWGNIILPNGQRVKGELFNDDSVQKILAAGGLLPRFTHYVKYGRTFHLPWSLGMHDDDRMHTTTSQWEGKRVVVTLKMDGENTTMYRDHIHARSVNSGGHPTRTWVKSIWASLAHEIAEGWRICGENLYAEHSIHYNELPAYFLGFSIWNNLNQCLAWDDTVELFSLLGIVPVPVLYDGIYDEKKLRKLHENLDFEKDEGYVLRIADSFTYGQFRKYVGKFVRPDHVKTTKHWMRGQEIRPNGLQLHDSRH